MKKPCRHSYRTHLEAEGGILVTCNLCGLREFKPGTVKHIICEKCGADEVYLAQSNRARQCKKCANTAVRESSRLSYYAQKHANITGGGMCQAEGCKPYPLKPGNHFTCERCFKYGGPSVADEHRSRVNNHVSV